MNKVIAAGVTHVQKVIGDIKASEKYKAASNQEKSAMLYTAISVVLSYQLTDIPSDTDIVIRQYYLTAVKPLCEDILSEVNETELIDYKRILDMIFPLYMSRYNLAHGKCQLPDIAAMLNASTAISGEMKAYMQGGLDAFA